MPIVGLYLYRVIMYVFVAIEDVVDEAVDDG